MRREFSTKVRVAAFQRSGGHCEKCTVKLYPGKIHYDHINPDGLTGEPTIANCAVLCVPCHNEKTTKIDVPAIAQAKRREAKHLGAKKPKRPWPKRSFSSRPPGSRWDSATGTTWKKT